MSDSKIISNTKELKLAQIKLKRIRAERDKIRVDLHSQETAKLKSTRTWGHPQTCLLYTSPSPRD